MNKALWGYNKLRGLPFGKYIFSRIICIIAPYFGTIKPRFAELRPGYCEITMKKRRRVQNHLKSVHAIAMCNLCELAGGTTLEVTLPASMRWIPRGMQVEYIKMAKSDLTGICIIPENAITGIGNLPVTVRVTDKIGTEVMKAIINMHITERNR